MNIRLLVLTLLFSGMIAGCSRPIIQPNDLFDCFVNPSKEKLARLAGNKPDTAILSHALHSLRASARSGICKEWLTDTIGLPYLVGYKTPDHISPARLPLVIYLHGGIGSERNDKGDSAFMMLIALADTFDLFLASPSANRYVPWWSPAGLGRILQTLRFMTLHYAIDPDRIFLAGVSDGATGCYAVANTIPGPFAGFFAVSGFGGMLPAMGMPLHAANLKRRPIYNVNAGKDRIYPVEQVQQFVAFLQDQGVPVISKIYPDEMHGFDYREKETGTLADFIRTWSRPHDESAALSDAVLPGMPDNLITWARSSGLLQ
ncbi:MAG: dienelactone hydrolase family protein [Chitinispirillaceae bacterium]|jgi:acetyl esterase/lipase|nr:dienelactone hydrolase family protein [Chitinispirillaceae bacterium]